MREERGLIGIRRRYVVGGGDEEVRKRRIGGGIGGEKEKRGLSRGRRGGRKCSWEFEKM